MSHSFLDLHSVSAVSSCHFFRSIRMCGVVSGQSCRPVRFRAALSTCPLVQNMPIASSYNIVPTLTTTALLDSSPGTQTERTLMPRSGHLSNKSAVSYNILGS